MMLSLFVLIVTILAVIWSFRKQRYFYGKVPLPPGPIRWPILGSVPQLLMEDLSYGHIQLGGLAKKYGPIVSFGFGVHFAVVVSDFEILKEVIGHTEETLERFRFEFMEQRNKFKNLGIIWSYGNVWKEQRKLVVRLLRQFGFGKKHTMEESIQANVDDLIVDIQNQTSDDGIWDVDINRLAVCAINNVWASVGGYRFDPKSSQIRRQLDLQNEVFESLGQKNLLGMFPFLKVFPELSGYKHHRDIQTKCRDFALELIEDAKIRRGDRVEPESFVEAYLDEIENNRTNPNSTTTEDQLVLTLMDLFLAGAETPSSLLTWIILYITVYPGIQQKAREEINKCIGRARKPINKAILTSIAYVQAIVWEVLRHAPLYTISTPRRVTRDIECVGYRIPKGTCFFANYYPMLHDTSVWGDGDIFRPERLLLPDGKLNPVKLAQIPEFGIGVRVCPGEYIAISSLTLVTVGLLRTFSFEVIAGREPKFELGPPSLTVKPKQFAVRVKTL